MSHGIDNLPPPHFILSLSRCYGSPTISAAYAHADAHARTGPTEFAIAFDKDADAGTAGSFNVLGDVAAKVCFPIQFFFAPNG